MSSLSTTSRPIPMSAPMVLSILARAKTKTRRLVQLPRWAMPCGENEDIVLQDSPPEPYAIARKTGCLSRIECPYGKPGDLLYVKEAWRAPRSLDDLSPSQIAEKCIDAGYRTPWCPIQYEADLVKINGWTSWGTDPREAEPGRYRHARFMPQWATRIWLEITGIRVERLQDISAADARAEGIQIPAPTITRAEFDHDCVVQYRKLWDSINGEGSWDLNPLVWVIEFNKR